MASLYDSALALFHRQASFRALPAIDAMLARPWIPVVAVSAYVVFVFGGGAVMKGREPFNLRGLTSFWNLLLATFSILGAIAMIPAVLGKLRAEGMEATVCRPWYFDGVTGLWMMLFTCSKIPEFIDTVLLVLQKKPVIFLHWYHHVTVMLFCWYSYMGQVTEGLWYCAMNFFVHAIMYSYYFLMSRKSTRPLVKPFAPFITFLQIAQMVVGLAIASYAHVVIRPNPGCEHNVLLNSLCIVMYASYFALFSNLFYRNYVKGQKNGNERKSVAKS